MNRKHNNPDFYCLSIFWWEMGPMNENMSFNEIEMLLMIFYWWLDRFSELKEINFKQIFKIYWIKAISRTLNSIASSCSFVRFCRYSFSSLKNRVNIRQLYLINISCIIIIPLEFFSYVFLIRSIIFEELYPIWSLTLIVMY